MRFLVSSREHLSTLFPWWTFSSHNYSLAFPFSKNVFEMVKMPPTVPNLMTQQSCGEWWHCHDKNCISHQSQFVTRHFKNQKTRFLSSARRKLWNFNHLIIFSNGTKVLQQWKKQTFSFKKYVKFLYVAKEVLKLLYTVFHSVQASEFLLAWVVFWCVRKSPLVCYSSNIVRIIYQRQKP